MDWHQTDDKPFPGPKFTHFTDVNRDHQAAQYTLNVIFGLLSEEYYITSTVKQEVYITSNQLNEQSGGLFHLQLGSFFFVAYSYILLLFSPRYDIVVPRQQWLNDNEPYPV